MTDREYWTKERAKPSESSRLQPGAPTSIPRRSGCRAEAALKRLEAEQKVPTYNGLVGSAKLDTN
jgi:hypothetical protein